jgi:hypothetical protein
MWCAMSIEQAGRIIFIGTSPEVKLCDPCWKEHEGLGVQALWSVSGIPMCDDHYGRVCHRCHRQWATKLRDGEFTYVCDGCDAVLERQEARRREYNQHLESKEWRKTKKSLRRESVIENGKAICSRCGLSEYENKQEYGEGLHGHHRTYERFGSERVDDLELLCSRCHAWEHRQPAPKPIGVSSGFTPPKRVQK